MIVGSNFIFWEWQASLVGHDVSTISSSPVRLAKEEAKLKAEEAANVKAQEVAKEKAEDIMTCPIFPMFFFLFFDERTLVNPINLVREVWQCWPICIIKRHPENY